MIKNSEWAKTRTIPERPEVRTEQGCRGEGLEAPSHCGVLELRAERGKTTPALLLPFCNCWYFSTSPCSFFWISSAMVKKA